MNALVWLWTLWACGGATPQPAPPCAALDGPACTEAAAAHQRAGEEYAAVLAYEDACVRLQHAEACGPASALLLGGAVAREAKRQDADVSGDRSPFGRAIVALRTGCALGDGARCHDLGMRALQGQGVPRDLERAREHFVAGCEYADAQSCLDGGLVTVQLGGSGADAAASFHRACELGLAQGCTRAGLALQEGLAAPPDPAGALLWLERGCQMGFAAGCGLAALATAPEAGPTADAARHRANLLAGADLGDWVALEGLLALAPGQADDMLALRERLGARCAADDAAACHGAGLLDEAWGQPVDTVADLWTRACRGGERVACGRLVALARAGAIDAAPLGRLADLEAAGCAAGWAPGCVAWGITLADGSEVEGVDVQGARRAFERACRGGVAEGCAALQRLDSTRSNGTIDTP